MASSPHTRTRTKATISANELAKYMLSGDHAREGIVRRAKQVPTAPVVRYRDLRQGLAAHLSDVMRSQTGLAALESRLQQKSQDSSLSPFAREDAISSLEALAAFRRLSNSLSPLQFDVLTDRLPALNIEGVAVNINPDVVVRQPHRTGDRFGIAIFRMAKGDDTDSVDVSSKRLEMGKFVAALAYMQACEMRMPDHSAHNSLCLSIDVQGELVTPASRNLTQRINNIRAACRVIATQWASA